MKTPEQIYDDYGFSAELPLGLGYLKINIIEAIQAYHDQFTQSYDYKAIPPAVDRSVETAKTMPSREDAEIWADNLCSEVRTDEGVFVGDIALDAMMAMYDYLKSNENKEV